MKDPTVSYNETMRKAVRAGMPFLSSDEQGVVDFCEGRGRNRKYFRDGIPLQDRKEYQATKLDTPDDMIAASWRSSVPAHVRSA